MSFDSGAITFAAIMVSAACGAIITAAHYFTATYVKASGSGGKTCPHCAERILKAANVCRYCKRDVANAGLTTDRLPTPYPRLPDESLMATENTTRQLIDRGAP